MQFEQREDGGHMGLENGFAIYADGNKIAVKEQLSIKEDYQLESIAPNNNPVYAAIGNSITHGTGHQSASFLTYPYVLADSMNWNLYNLAIAGARTGWPIALLFKNKEVDFITIALGFNDWMWDNKPLSDKLHQYEKLLDSLRYFQSNAKIFCITPLSTAKTETQLGAPFSLQDYRTMLMRHVNTRRNLGDHNIFLVHGDSLSNPSMLMDGIHLSKTGAPLFAAKLQEKLRELLAVTNSIKTEHPEKLDFNLKHNYPNPFNPATKIIFYTNKATEIKLNILNLKGQKVATIFKGKVARGHHQFVFQGDDLPAGIYFYNVKSRNYCQTKKMTLLK